MEATAPAPANPFVGRNGADLYHGRLDLDSEDFGPETDVDMVDDVLLSPSIAAAKKLGLDADLERQRQQLSEFDDPADLEHSRDTPTPPAHEVASNAIVDPLGESGEESEEEWNYIPGKDPNTSTSQEEDDMSSQLNPDAAEFVPVSPTRLMMLDEAIISASSYDNKNIENVQMPTELEFGAEIKKRPGDLEYTNGATKPVDYFMRDNFSSLPNKVKDFNVSTACPELSDSSILSFKPISDNGVSVCASESVPFDNLEAVKSFDVKENMFGTNKDISSNVFEANHIFGKGDPMTTSIIGGLPSDAEGEGEGEDSMAGTPKSTSVEAPVSPSNEEVPPLNHQGGLEDSPADELVSRNQSSDLLFSEEPQENVALDEERPSSELASLDRTLEDNDGYITEHRRSPPIDLSFKPIQNFSDTNPFGALQTPGSINTPIELSSVVADVMTEHGGFPVETKDDTTDQVPDSFGSTQKTRTSFISLRSPCVNEIPVSFDALESPVEDVHFEPPPSANTSILASELPKSPLDEVNLQESMSDMFESSQQSLGSPHLDTTAGFEVEERKVLQEEPETKVSDNITVDTLESVDQPAENEMVSPASTQEVVEGVLASFDDIVDENKPHKDKKEFDVDVETMEMKLEFESQIAPLESPSEVIKKFEEGFEVISKEELSQEGNLVTEQNESNTPFFTDLVNPLSPTKQTNPFSMDESLSERLLDAQTEKQDSFSDFSSVIDKLSSDLKVDSLQPENTNSLTAENTLPAEPEVTKTVAYQTLTPADEPKLEKTVAYTTGVEEVLKDEPASVPVVPTNEPVQSQVMTETLIPVLGEVTTETPASTPAVESLAVTETLVPALSEVTTETPSSTPEVQSQAVTEALIQALGEVTAETPSPAPAVESQAVTEALLPALSEMTTETPPPTPAPGFDSALMDDSRKTDTLVAAVAAAGAVAGAVAAATAVIPEKEVKKATTAPAKKPAVGAAKKPSDATTKAPAKTVPAKAPAAKSAPAKPATTKPASAATKPASMATKPATTVAGPKPSTTKPASAPAAKKPAPSSPVKPSSARPATTAAPKPAGTAATKPVPKQLPVNKTASATLKPASKPSTPTSKPTTPTTPKAPSVMKSDVVKSPPRPAAKLTVGSTRPTSGTTKPLGVTGEKKPLTNGDIKPLAKKPEDATKKPLTLAAKTAAKPSAPATKTTPPVGKAPLSAASKTAAAKPAAASQAKPKAPAAAAPTKQTMPPPIKRPVPATATKTVEKPVKDAVNKTISSTKPAVNGKTNPGKPTVGVKKTDVKLNGKSVPKKVVEEVKKEEEKEEVAAIQEEHVTTTNGYSEEHNVEENGSMKIEEFEQVLIDSVN